MITEADKDFAVTLHWRVSIGGRCDADRCTETSTLAVVLCYCYCDEHTPGEHGHPNSTHPSAGRSQTALCDKHGAIVAHTWQCFESMTNGKALS